MLDLWYGFYFMVSCSPANGRVNADCTYYREFVSFTLISGKDLTIVVDHRDYQMQENHHYWQQ